jgi:hypothetical protein
MHPTISRAALLVLALSLPQASAKTPPATADSGEMDFNRLRQLIEQSRVKKPPSAEQQRMGVFNELKIDRSPAGMFEARLAEARSAAAEVKPMPEKPTPEQELERFKADAEAFRIDLALGRWEKVDDFFTALPKAIADDAYKSLVTKLAAPVSISPTPEMLAQGAKPYSLPIFLPPMEWLGLAAAAPNPPKDEVLKTLAKLLQKEPRPPAEFFESLFTGIRHFGGKDGAERRRAAEILLESGFAAEATPLIPDVAEAREKPDYAAMNLIARHRVALAKSDPKAAGKDAIPLAWELSTLFLTDPKAPQAARAEAMFRALSLIPELGDNRGRDWFTKTFETPEGGGVELLASLGTLTAQNRDNNNQLVRLEQLRLQQAAVRALLASGADATAWSGIFTLYARQWVHEAGVTQQLDKSGSRRRTPQYDMFGNMFYQQESHQFQGQGTPPIASGDLLECRPDEAWLALLEPTTGHECLTATARLFLKVKEEDGAIPLIQTMAATRKADAVSLVKETIRVWAENHNPNKEQDYRSRYMYYYGYNSQAGSIPLTRSKQERNLIDLATLVKGIRSLDLGEPFHQELADAFISCHSKAEVWRVESIEAVFGATDVLDAMTLSSLVGRMRMNLAGLWPNPKLQQAYQTKRKDKELQEQILHGYTAASMVLENALEKKPAESWRLSYQLAAARFEESNYRSSLAPDNTHSAMKRASLDALAAAAGEYSASLPLEDQAKETAEVFETWFYAALGSPSLEALKGHHLPTPAEYPLIKAALEGLPGEAAERHLKKFATTLNQRLANVGPDLKLRYLEAATAICGDRKELADAADVLAYYRDLVSEIELSSRIDGSDRISPDKPFGLQVNLRHTRQIEREAGGFQRYLQNQTNQQYAWNFGRPPEDYRDKFDKAARAVLEEHFEILSLTFHGEKTESRTDPDFGWRLTPYAYFLLKPKGPQIDRIPSLKIDLDFMDTSGYAIIPITSAEIPVDSSGQPEPRPFRDLRITQTLDERSHAEDGSLYLEIKATAHGLIPPLEEILDIALPGFVLGKIEDRGLRIAELDAATDDLAPVSEAEWRIELKSATGSFPANFRFPNIKLETAKEDGLLMQRYVDVDLVPVLSEVRLDMKQGRLRHWMLAGVALLLIPMGFLAVRAQRRRKAPTVTAKIVPLPSHFTPVTVLGFLRRLRGESPLTPDHAAGLEKEIALMESGYFGTAAPIVDPAALEEIATRWQQASHQSP